MTEEPLEGCPVRIPNDLVDEIGEILTEEGYMDLAEFVREAVRKRLDELERRKQLTKKNLLEHYATGDVHKFIQIDGWRLDDKKTNIGNLSETDDDGDCLNAGETLELRHMPAALAVRIFIHEGTDHEDAVRLIKKMLDWVERRPELLEPNHWNEKEAEG